MMTNLRNRSDGFVRQLARQPVRLLNMIHADLMRFAGMKPSRPGAQARAGSTGLGGSRKRQRYSGRRSLGTELKQAADRSVSYDGLSLENVRGAVTPEDECIYAIGDVHGQDILLDRLLKKIEADASSLPDHVDPILVFLGDYVDRGIGSKRVVEMLTSERLGRFSSVFIAGNHEDALLRFHADPSVGREWVMYGGRETLVSYGVKPPAAAASEDAWIETWQAFRDALPDHHLDFFKKLEHSHSRGDYMFVHAGLRPGVPLWKQSTHDMMWIRTPFLNDRTQFAKLVVHGHTPASAPELDDRRLGLDTGAYSTGILTAARLCGLDVSIIST